MNGGILTSECEALPTDFPVGVLCLSQQQQIIKETVLVSVTWCDGVQPFLTPSGKMLTALSYMLVTTPISVTCHSNMSAWYTQWKDGLQLLTSHFILLWQPLVALVHTPAQLMPVYSEGYRGTVWIPSTLAFTVECVDHFIEFWLQQLLGSIINTYCMV